MANFFFYFMALKEAKLRLRLTLELKISEKFQKIFQKKPFKFRKVPKSPAKNKP